MCRMDTTLLDFSEMKWERGDVTFLFNGHMKPSRSLIVLDNKQKVYQYVRYEVSCYIYVVKLYWYIRNNCYST